jgi:hypothetical protein
MEGDANATWSPALEEIIRKEGEQSEVFFYLHNKASGWASRRNDIIQIPVIVLSTLTGFFSATSNLVPPIALGGISVFVGILGTLNSYYKFSQRSESHKIISLLYMKIYKTIEVELALPIPQRTDPNVLLKELRQSMSQIGEQAPSIPEGVIASFKTAFKDATTSRPIIANGLDPIKIFRSTTASTPRSPSTTIETQTAPNIRIELAR